MKTSLIEQFWLKNFTELICLIAVELEAPGHASEPFTTFSSLKNTVFSVFSAPGACKIKILLYHFYPIISPPPFD